MWKIMQMNVLYYLVSKKIDSNSNQNARLVNILFLVLVQKMLVHREIWNKTFQPNAFYIQHKFKKLTRDFVQCFYEEVGHTSWF